MNKSLEYYQYSVPRIKIRWNGKDQPGMYKTAIEAKNVIDGYVMNFGSFEIVTPDGIIPVVR